MKNLWDQNEALVFGKESINQRVYSSRLLGRCPELVLHGGGNTSVKGKSKNVFGERVETLFVKGSGWDLISIEKEGFAPVDLNYLKRLSNLKKLSDSQMVAEQKSATLNPSAPSPSVEAILHALIPYKFVDHTHADAVLSISNTPNGQAKISKMYGEEILIIPYVMPGFILAKKVAEVTKDTDWSKIKGMILLNHGVFSFGDDAKQSYDRMIEIVTVAENYLKKNLVWKKYAKGNSVIELRKLAKIRKKASVMEGRACLAVINDTPEAVGFSKMKIAKILSSSGTLTPDHVIRTKPFAWIIESDFDKSAEKFTRNYDSYFNKYRYKNIKKIRGGPKWALWPGHGIVCFGSSMREASIVSDINRHTIRAMQTSYLLDGWKPIPFSDLFQIEYWELEQAKLRNGKNDLEFKGKIAIVTGAASGIGYACTEKLLEDGCAVVGLDKNPNIENLFDGSMNYKGLYCDLTKTSDVKKSVFACVKKFGGLDILISNAGIFSSSKNLEDIDDKKWKHDLDINLTTHHKILRESIPFLKFGIDPVVVFMGSRNVGAPGPGAGTYTIAKSGLTQMSRLAAIELAKYNIRVNTLHPDCVYDTNVWSDKILKARAEQYGISITEYKKRNLLKTDVSSKDVAELATFFASSMSRKTTGAQIPIDGGNDRII